MNIFGKKKINAFGLDISDTSIKILQLKHDGKATVLQAFADVPLSDKVISNNVITSSDRLAQNIMKAVTAAKHVDTKYVVCSIPETKSFVRTLEIPKIPEDEIDGAIPYELEQDIPISIDQVYMDWQLIHEMPQTLKLLVTATPKEYVDALLSSLRSIKLRPLGFELESQATARALVGPSDMDKSVLIADLSTLETSFIVVTQGIIEYTSSIAVAGKAFTESISRNGGIGFDEAEKLKRDSGLTLDAQGKTRQAILPVLDNILDEIKNVIRFFEEHSNRKNKIDTILFCGGSAKLPGLVEYASKQLMSAPESMIKKVRLGNPWVNIPSINSNGLMPEQDSLGFVTATGLALRGFNHDENN